jgi:hypothetical protein
MSETTETTFDPEAWQAFAEQVGAPPQDVARKLEHARTWERRAKDNADAAQRLPEVEQALGEWQTKAETAGSRATELETENVRLKVAIAKGVPPALVDRLKGSSEDELAADADQLLGLLAPAAPGSRLPAPDPAQGGQGVPALNSDALLDTVKSKLGIT